MSKIHIKNIPRVGCSFWTYLLAQLPNLDNIEKRKKKKKKTNEDLATFSYRLELHILSYSGKK